jgi:hypothetical protein
MGEHNHTEGSLFSRCPECVRLSKLLPPAADLDLLGSVEQMIPTQWHDTRRFIYWPDGTRVYPQIEEEKQNEVIGRNYHFDPATMRIVEDD